MAITLYKSTDASAPVLNNVSGSFITVLNACLVNGYGTKPSAGFTKHASSTGTLAAYKSGEATASGHWLVVSDTSTTSVNNLVGAEKDTFTNTTTYGKPFPSLVQNAQVFTKSASGTVPWFCITDGFIFYFGTHYNNDTRLYQMGFGDIDTFKVGDLYNCILIGGYSSVYGHGTMTEYTATNTHFMPRSYTQSGLSIPVGISADITGLTRSGIDTSNFIYPSQVDNGLIVVPVVVTEPAPVYSFRGILPGVYYTPQKVYGAIVNYAEFTSVIGLSGKTLMYTNCNFGQQSGGLFYDLTGPWR